MGSSGIFNGGMTSAGAAGGDALSVTAAQGTTSAKKAVGKAVSSMRPGDGDFFIKGLPGQLHGPCHAELEVRRIAQNSSGTGTEV
jgi:hypothetical protein